MQKLNRNLVTKQHICKQGKFQRRCREKTPPRGFVGTLRDRKLEVEPIGDSRRTLRCAASGIPEDMKLEAGSKFGLCEMDTQELG